MSDALLFVYGTLRPAFDGPMARWLRSVAKPVGAAVANGRLYRVADYPGLVAGEAGMVAGDLLALTDAAATLARLDEHEECSDHFPEPHEYRRVLIIVRTTAGPVEAWTYVYAWPVDGLERIVGGDFLA